MWPERQWPTHSERKVEQVAGEKSEDQWHHLDQFELENVFTLRLPMLKTCLLFSRGRFRVKWESFCVKGSELSKRVMRRPVLFALVPTMLLHRPRGPGSIGRKELSQRAVDVANGRWTDLIRQAVGQESRPKQRRRGKAPPEQGPGPRSEDS